LDPLKLKLHTVSTGKLVPRRLTSFEINIIHAVEKISNWFFVKEDMRVKATYCFRRIIRKYCTAFKSSVDNFNDTGTFTADLSKTPPPPSIKFHKHSPSSNRVVPCGQMEGQHIGR